MDICQFLDQVKEWVSQQPDIYGLLLVGSHASGQATSKSDVDLVFITELPKEYLDDNSWIDRFGLIRSKTIEDWGMLSSVRVFFASGLEVEFGITSLEWIAYPLDEGTHNVLKAGYKILYDKKDFFTKMITAPPP